VDAKVEGRAYFVSFSASTEYKTVNKETSMHHTKFVSSIARCNVYRADIRLAAMNRLSTDFMHSVNKLPLDDYGPYLQLISVYGTHFVNSVVMGAKAIIRSQFTSTAFKSLKSKHKSIGASVSASVGAFGGGVSAKVSQTGT